MNNNKLTIEQINKFRKEIREMIIDKETEFLELFFIETKKELDKRFLNEKL